jgi:hypothetical protein
MPASFTIQLRLKSVRSDMEEEGVDKALDRLAVWARDEGFELHVDEVIETSVEMIH